MVGRPRSAVNGLPRLLIVLLGVASAGRSPAASTPLARRCQLISKILDFKVEVHPGTFRSSVADDPETHRLAYWHDRPVVCAYAGTRGRHEVPLFSDDEGCNGEKFDLFNATIGKDAGSPEACVGAVVAIGVVGPSAFLWRTERLVLTAGARLATLPCPHCGALVGEAGAASAVAAREALLSRLREFGKNGTLRLRIPDWHISCAACGADLIFDPGVKRNALTVADRD